MEFRTRLLELIEEKADGQQKIFAQMTDIPATTINCWITKNVKPTCTQIIKIADTFNITADYVLGRENDYGLVEVRNTNTPKETEVLSLFNALDEAHQVMMIDIMKKFADTTEKEKAF